MLEEILSFKVRTERGLEELNLAEDLRFSEENLNDAYVDQSAKYAYWATLAAQSKWSTDKKKLEVESYEDNLKALMGELNEEVRQDFAMNGEKITESRVEHGVYSHHRYINAMNRLHDLKAELLELQYQTNLLYSAKDAFSQRKDMIISLGANIRQEKSNTI